MSEGTGKEVHARDWECLDCETVYCTDEDATRYDLPDFCPECGDTPGWKNRKTGRTIP
jgi:hypothetical protein